MSITPKTLDTRLRSLERTKASHRGMIRCVNMQALHDAYESGEPVKEHWEPDTPYHRTWQLSAIDAEIREHIRKDKKDARLKI